MRTMTLALAVAAAVALAPPAPAQFGGILRKAKEKVDQAKPVTDRAQRAADTFTPWSAEEEQRIGVATATKMVAMFGLAEDPKLVRYLNLVGHTVAQFAPRQLPYRFAVLDTEIVGAFALPGGFIFVTRASLGLMKNEAELAGALAHELVHVSERHLEREIRSKNVTLWAAEEGQRANLSDADLRARADVFVRDMFNMRLSRDKEAASDEQGTLLAAKAGYAAGGLLEFLRALATANKDPGNSRMFGQLLSTHPSFEDRIAQLEPIVAKAGGQGQGLEARFQAAIAIAR